MKTTLKIEGMSCNHCVSSVRSALLAVPGVSGADVSLSEGLATVEHTDSASSAQMVDAVKEEGYEAKVG